MRRIGAVLSAGAMLLLAGCAPAASAPGPGPASSADDVRVIADVPFGGPDDILLDVCLPEDAAPGSPAVLSVHGGGWRAGDKAQRPWREVCTWLASAGFVVFQPNYRLAPEHPFPAALDDLGAAIEWIGEDEQVTRFGHDPSRLGAFGDSAGGNLVAVLATTSRGSAESIDAVVELSAPLDLTSEGIARGGLDESFQGVQLDYLGCDSYADCPDARDASPLYAVDPTDPPFFVVASTDDFIPVEQAEDFVEVLESANVEAEFVRLEGDGHALALLDDALRVRVADWLRGRLAA